MYNYKSRQRARSPKQYSLIGFSIGFNRAEQKAEEVYSSDVEGEVSVPFASIYGSFGFENGVFLDLVGRYAYMSSNSKYTDGAMRKIPFNVSAGVLAVETALGYRYDFGNGFDIVPAAELSYAQIVASKFQDGAGYQIEYKPMNSLQVAGGVMLQYSANGFKPFAGVKYIRELEGKLDVVYDGAEYASDIGGGRFEIGGGINGEIGNGWMIGGKVAYQTGDKEWKNIYFGGSLRRAF